MAGLTRLATTGRQIVAESLEKNVTFMAAGIAYNAFISLAPILLVLLLVVSAIGGGLEDRVVVLMQRALPGPIADVVTGIFGGDSASSGASVVGLIVLIWGTLKLFRGLDTAFSEIYETTEQNSFLDKLLDGVVVSVALLVAIVSTVGVTALFTAVSDSIPLVGALMPVVLLVGLVVGFLPMYYRFPDADVEWRHVVPGAAFAAVGWAAFQAVFQVYLSFTGGNSGTFFGGVVVVITWLYASGLVLLLGAVINAVLGGHSSGEAGGIGRGATGYETEREIELSREEFAMYVEGLETGVAGPPASERGTPSTTDTGDPRYPPPSGDITVIEQSKPDGDELEWAISIRWRASTDDQGG